MTNGMTSGRVAAGLAGVLAMVTAVLAKMPPEWAIPLGVLGAVAILIGTFWPVLRRVRPQWPIRLVGKVEGRSTPSDGSEVDRRKRLKRQLRELTQQGDRLSGAPVEDRERWALVVGDLLEDSIDLELATTFRTSEMLVKTTVLREIISNLDRLQIRPDYDG